MANNRMFLVHIPSKLGIYIGKRMGFGWYDAPEKPKLEAFYDYLEQNPIGSQDDFTLIMESSEESRCTWDWDKAKKHESGFLYFNLNPKKL
jgi:hypothetical protein